MTDSRESYQLAGHHTVSPGRDMDSLAGVRSTSGTPLVVHEPVIDSWTQFSGIPTTPPACNVTEASNFSWGFHPQSSTPPAASSYSLNIPDFFSPYHQSLLQNVSISNTGNIEPDYRPADNLSRSSTSFEEASKESHDIYPNAVKHWGPFTPYNPFGTSDILNSASPEPPKPSEQKQSEKKPTYSDVAKSGKNKTVPITKQKDENDLLRKKMLENSQRYYKANKKLLVSRGSAAGYISGEEARSVVDPDSKYGLDQFEDVKLNKLERQTEESAAGICPLSRKCSTGGGTRGVENIDLSKNLNSCTHKVSHNASDLISDKLEGTGTKSSKPSNRNNAKPFFDPKRIFQTKSTTKAGNKVFSSSSNHPMVLNNGKPSCASKPSTTAHKKSSDYIINDLSDSYKSTNRDIFSKNENSKRTEDSAYISNVKTKTKDSVPQSVDYKRQNNSTRHLPLHTSFDQEVIDEWLAVAYDKTRLFLHQTLSMFITIVLLLVGLFAYIVSGCAHIFDFMWKKVKLFIDFKVYRSKYFSDWKEQSKYRNEVKRKLGLDANINLPATGDEAMQRLLACKGKDPYSILGLHVAASDDDIRKYYRRQAVLVHPDKNQQPGAEEAFKILGHAFDLIGDPEKRKLYDAQLHEVHEAEAAMKEFNDLLTKLQEKIQEAANMMHCDNCGGKHRRVPVDQPWYKSRFCDRCNTRHSAKEGDVWAETSVFGFLWHYYACMEGKVYDITEWVACKKDFFKHMQANAHHVFYRIATEGNRAHHHGRSGEADLDDFISHLFNQAVNKEGTESQWQQPKQPAGSSQNWNSGTGKKNRRKKKKH